MVTTRYYLDCRNKEAGKPMPLKLCIVKKGASAYIPVGITLLPSQWNSSEQKVVGHPSKQTINTYLGNRKTEIDNLILSLTAEGKLAGLSAVQIKNVIVERIDPDADASSLLISRFKQYGESRDAQRTRELYSDTLKKLQEFDSRIGTLSFDSINKDWLNKFSRWMIDAGLSKNTRNIHFRNLRAVFNDAIDNGVTQNYPFRKFDMTPEETLKRSLPVARLRELFGYPVEPWQQRYVDYFKLTFFLMGINTVDLLACTRENIIDGRLVYQRSKTGKLYNIKIEPEAAELLERYRGTDLLVNFGEGRSHYHNFTGKCDKGLKSVGRVEMVLNKEWTEGCRKHRYHKERISAFPGISIYWARHSWASIAASLDIPRETVSAGLGHIYGSQTTAIYIDFDMKKVDEANRRIMDWVLYGKK